MKAILIFLLMSGIAFAQEKETLRDVIKVLDNPSKAVNDPQCQESSNTVANSCVSLSSTVCAITNPQTGLKPLQKRAAGYATVEFNQETLPTLEAIEQVEREVFETSLVKQEDLVQLFNEVRVSMLEAINRNPDLTPAQRGEMRTKIQTVQFMSGPEYLRNRETNRSQNETAEVARLKGLRNYNNECGNGTLVSAFNQLDKVVFCPGLIQSLMDFNPRTKREALNSLAFTMGHEIAHSIDSSSDRFPAPYERMRSCYNQLPGSPGGFEARGPEIAADFWGAQIFSERLRADNLTGSEAVRALALAADDFCTLTESEGYPSGRARLDLTVGRDPAIRQSLGCEAPTREAPVCTIAGAVPEMASPNVASTSQTPAK